MIASVENLPRLRLGFYPTPLTEARHLSSILGGPRILIKREDLSGLASGGNKCRMLEFILAEAKKQGADAVISTAGCQSNYCLQIAAAARKLGMKPSFILLKDAHCEIQGNLLLHNVLDSDVEILELADMSAIFGEFVSEKTSRIIGSSPYSISTPPSSFNSWASCGIRLYPSSLRQAQSRNPPFGTRFPSATNRM